MATIDELRGWKLAFERGFESGRKHNRKRDGEPMCAYPVLSREAKEWKTGFAKGEEERNRK